ncbi:MAG: ATP phosphoribosyltransferase regulatory subunit [Clostridia bacterium]|nr:ATP phosphoribosyltransferase regulatory subunit [Clostridia bacterium]
MNDIYSVLTPDEREIFTLRALYSQYGYKQYKMSKFEEYDLYFKNKDFLISENVITFTDTDGRLLALKPDVTLSIVKSSRASAEKLIKAQYNENVYRISDGTNSFKELMQVGLECIGEVSEKEICEVIMLAAKSLYTISEKNILAISNTDVAKSVIAHFNMSEDMSRDMLTLLGEKNSSEMREMALSAGISENDAALIASLAEIYGTPCDVLPRLDAFRLDDACCSAIDGLISVITSLESLGVRENLKIDFSIVSDTSYYNGIAMQGFIEGIPASVISGGQYDNLMKKMGRATRAIGFAVYLDELERFFAAKEGEI